MPPPDVLPRWQDDYADTKKERGPGGALAAPRWPKLTLRLVLLLAVAAAAFFLLSGGDEEGGKVARGGAKLGALRREWAARRRPGAKAAGHGKSGKKAKHPADEDDEPEAPAEDAEDEALAGDEAEDADVPRKNAVGKKHKGSGDSSGKHKVKGGSGKANEHAKDEDEDEEPESRETHGKKRPVDEEEEEPVKPAKPAPPAPAKAPPAPPPPAPIPIKTDISLPNPEDVIHQLSGAGQKPPSPPPPPAPAHVPEHVEAKRNDGASAPPYAPADFPALRSQLGCHTPRCDIHNLTYARTMILHSWRSYMKYAKGSDDLYPMNKAPRNWYGSHSLLNTPIDALDTLWLAGLREEYEEARTLVETFEPNWPLLVSFFETTIRQLGGLLSAYALTGEKDQMLLDKAKNLGDRLSGAFTLSGGGLPMGQVNLRDGQASPLSWMGGGLGLAEVGTFQLEFAYLGHVLGGEEGKQYINRVDRANDALQKLRSQLKVKGLYPFKIMPGFDNPSWAYDGSYKIGGGVDSFYEYLVKQWIMLSKEPTHLREMFDEAAKAMIENLGVNKTVNGRQLVFFPDGNPGAPGSSHEHLACFMGGTLALAARTWEPEEGMAPDEIEKQKQWQEQVYEWGKGFTKTCRDSYADQPSGIGPEAIDFSQVPIRPTAGSYGHQYLLRPETVESIFYMWRLTHDQIYRDWAWEIMRAIQRHCATPNGYAGLTDVTRSKGPMSAEEEERLSDATKLDFADSGVPHVDLQESFFLAETMKYLLLIFADDELLPLDKWTFNTEAHPFPVHSQKKQKKKKHH